MATVKEEFELLKAKILAGKGAETIHVVWHEQERKRRRENPEKSTRVIINTHSPEAYVEIRGEIDRIMAIGVDPHINAFLLAKILKSVTDEQLREWVKEGPSQAGDADAGPGPAKAEFPEWTR